MLKYWFGFLFVTFFLGLAVGLGGCMLIDAPTNAQDLGIATRIGVFMMVFSLFSAALSSIILEKE